MMVSFVIFIMKRKRGGENLIDVFVCPDCQESFATRKNLLIHYNRWCADREVAVENLDVAVDDAEVNAEDKKHPQA